MDKTFSQLEQELVESKKREENLKKRAGTWKERALEAKRYQKSLIGQYERIIKEWQNMYKNLIENGWKIVLTKIVLKYKEIKEGRRK